jgi:hypothetical protein
LVVSEGNVFYLLLSSSTSFYLLHCLLPKNHLKRIGRFIIDKGIEELDIGPVEGQDVVVGDAGGDEAGMAFVEYDGVTVVSY